MAGYATQPRFDGRSIRIFREHRRDELQYEHYADDWFEEDDANGWRCSEC